MYRGQLLVFCLLLTSWAQFGLSQKSEVGDLTIQNAETSWDISSQLVQGVHKLKIENTGSGDAKHFIFTVHPKLAGHLSYLSAASGSADLKSFVISIPNQELSYKIDFASPLAKGKTVDVEVEAVYTKHLVPFPEEITQKDKQLVKFIASHYLYSPYKVVKQTSKVSLASKSVESYTKLKPHSQSDSAISFGPYENIAPYTDSELVVHYENNSPFLTITNMERTIEVSHWGNIAVEERIEILHTGAKLKGSFSRFDYQREANSGINSIKAFKTLLPASARDVYYRDDIGNISTSNMYQKHDSVELTLRPRFPLFGGWKTRYVIGYNLPSYEYLYSDGSQYALKMRLIDHVYDSLVVEHLTVKIILPEGSSNLNLKVPYAVKQLPRSLHFTYLDVTGRPVITLTKDNLVEHHIQDFTLEYTFPKLYMLREPLVVIVAFMVLFLTVLIYVRLDFSISSAKATKVSPATAGAVESVLRRQSKRASIYENLENQINKLKSNKDLSSYQSAFKSVSADYRAETAGINDVISKLRSEAPELAETITELQRLDRGYWEVFIQYGTSTEKFVSNKMQKTQYADQEKEFEKKRTELADRIDQIVKNL